MTLQTFSEKFATILEQPSESFLQVYLWRNKKALFYQLFVEYEKYSELWFRY